MKYVKSILWVLAVAMLLSGCSLYQINPERDGARVVGKVNDEIITKKEVYDYLGIDWDYEVEYWQEEDLQESKLSALDQLVSKKLQVSKCKELGFYDFTDEDLQEIEDNYNTYVGSLYDTAYENNLEKAKEDSSIDPAAEAQASVDNYLASFGYTAESLRAELEDNQALNKLRDMVHAEVEIDEEQVSSFYESLAYNQATQYTTSDAAFAAYNQGQALVYYPEKTHKVKNILIALEVEDRTAVSEARTAGDDENADALREEAAKKIVDKANEVLEQLKGGADFDELLAEYNEDTGMDDLDGYLVSESYTGYVQEFTDAAMALTEVGETTELVLTDFGYHIILLTEIIPQGAREYEECQEEVEAQLKEETETALWNERYQEWYEAAKIKTYKNRLK